MTDNPTGRVKLSEAQRAVLQNIADRQWVDIRRISEPYRQAAIDLAMHEPALIDIDADQMYCTPLGRQALSTQQVEDDGGDATPGEQRGCMAMQATMESEFDPKNPNRVQMVLVPATQQVEDDN